MACNWLCEERGVDEQSAMCVGVGKEECEDGCYVGDGGHGDFCCG